MATHYASQGSSPDQPETPVPVASYKPPETSDLGDSDDSDVIFVGHWAPGASTTPANNLLNMPNSKTSPENPRKRTREDEDRDWTTMEEYIPPTRRGRPKGSKNQAKVPPVMMTCFICDWSGNDSDMLAHAVNVHSQPDMNHYQCPLCRAHFVDEIELQAHMDQHKAELTM